ncbi:hypothetical protein [Ethanoligenens harbinense]|uniref:hypothetical protein n=1 Tax=Ethanoligenens harbinense TaxID=253239 RepID=UPI0010C0897A|nr:hypothetical protein [Ethanoligenens harbinense]
MLRFSPSIADFYGKAYNHVKAGIRLAYAPICSGPALAPACLQSTASKGRRARIACRIGKCLGIPAIWKLLSAKTHLFKGFLYRLHFKKIQD